MADDLHIGGADKLRLLALHLRQMGADRSIVNNLSKRLRRLARPVRDEIRASARRVLPKRGGLGEWVANSTIKTSVRRSEKTAGVFITVGKGQHDITAMNAGNIRHPLWGNKKHWYPQAVNPGFGTEVRDGPIADQFRQEMGAAVDEAIAEVLHGL